MVDASLQVSRTRQSFRIYLAGQGLSSVGDAIALVAVPLLVLDATGSLVQMGLITALSATGRIVAAPFAGPLVDRVDRRRILIVCDFARTILNLLVPLTWWTTGPNIGLLYVVAFIGGFFADIFVICGSAALANLVDRDEFVEANGRLHATTALAALLGPILAGFICYRFDPAVALGFNGLSFLISVASLLLVKLRPNEASKDAPPNENSLSVLLAGVKWVREQPAMRSLAIFFGGVHFLFASRIELFVYHIKNVLGGDDKIVGIVLSCAALGAVVTAMRVAALRRRFGFVTCWMGAGVLSSTGIFVVSIVHSWPLVVLGTVLFTAGDMIWVILGNSLRQELTPDRLLGRVTAAFWLLFNIGGPLGASAIPAIASKIGTRVTFALVGVCLLLWTFSASRGALRKENASTQSQN